MAPTQSAKIILLAEDEFSIRSLVLAILQEAGYNVIVAMDGRECLEKSRQFRGTIHLLLSDVDMPNMTGIELATQIQIDRPAMRIMLMSGMASGMLLLNDSWQFLPKPFTSNLLEEWMRQLLLGETPSRNWTARWANKWGSPENRNTARTEFGC